jgi:hypothetical protein
MTGMMCLLALIRKVEGTERTDMRS